MSLAAAPPWQSNDLPTLRAGLFDQTAALMAYLAGVAYRTQRQVRSVPADLVSLKFDHITIFHNGLTDGWAYVAERNAFNCPGLPRDQVDRQLGHELSDAPVLCDGSGALTAHGLIWCAGSNCPSSQFTVKLKQIVGVYDDRPTTPCPRFQAA